MLVAAYVVSAALEIIGISLVVFDIFSDRARRTDLTKKQYEVYGGSRRRSGTDTALLMRRDISPEAQKVMANRMLENDRRLGALEANAKRADELLQGVLLGMVSTPLWRRLIGPVLVVLGVIVGAIANIHPPSGQRGRCGSRGGRCCSSRKAGALAQIAGIRPSWPSSSAWSK